MKSAQELGATHVMEGTVRREGNQVRLTLQLVDAGTDRYLWSKTYDRALASAMTLQSEVAAEVAEQMSVRLAGGVQTPRVTHDPEAYDLYLQALLALRELGVRDLSAGGQQSRICSIARWPATRGSPLPTRSAPVCIR